MDKLVFLDPDDIKEEPFTTSKGCVYILDLNNGMVKIGRSTNPLLRIRNISTQSGFPISQYFITDFCKNYKEIEISMHDYFKSKIFKSILNSTSIERMIK